MDFSCYYRPELNQIAVFYVPEAGEHTPGSGQGLRGVMESSPCYDTIVSESRIASYIGIATGKLPSKVYFGAWRTFPEHYDRTRQKAVPVGFARRYLGVEVFEGAYTYAGMRIVPGWGGSMFEALMPALFVPEEKWGAKSWAINHPLTVAAQIYHGLVEAKYGYWGFSPANIPEGGYTTYGVAAIGMSPAGYASAEEAPVVAPGCPGAGTSLSGPSPTEAAAPHAEETDDFRAVTNPNGVVTPHASFLALRWAPRAALENLARLERDFPIYSQEWGFCDSVNVSTRAVSDSYLALDQGIILAAIGNALARDMLRRAFATPEFRGALRPVIALEEFNAGPRERLAELDREMSPADSGGPK
jgi:hypothetical protein